MTTGGWHPAFCWCLTFVMAWCGGAKAEAPAAPAVPYQDRVLEDLPPNKPLVEPDMARNLNGWPRFVRVESRWAKDSTVEQLRARQNPYLYGLVETPNLGILSIDGEIGADLGLGSMTLRQSDLPMADGWWANHELGLVYTSTLPLSRKPSRVYVPSALVRGIKGEWMQRSEGFHAQASIGEPAWIDSTQSNGLRKNGGRRLNAGLQWGSPLASDPDEESWTAAVQVESGRALSMTSTGLDLDQQTKERLNADSVLLAARHETPDSRLQVNVLRSQDNGGHARVHGWWMDSSWGSDRRQRSAGLYWLAPGLNWAGLPMAHDLAGVYARRTWQERQWSAEGSVDWLRSIDQPQRQGYYVTSAARWRLHKLHQIGAGLSVRRYAGAGWSSFLDWRWKNPWGLGGVRWDQSSFGAQAREQQLMIDQDWTVVRGWGLTSSFSLMRADQQSHLSAGLTLAAPLSTYASARANLNSGINGTNGRHLNLALGLTWRLMRDWHLEAQYTRYSGKISLPSLDPLAPPPPPALKLDNWSLFVVLRFEWQAGSAMAPMGGRPREGGGRIEGTVYLDANRNGRQDADEAGASGVQVYLDNRYVARTDAHGRYEFALVAVGQHTVSVRNDSLPLPWSIVGDGQMRVSVGLRDGLIVDFPVQRTE